MIGVYNLRRRKLQSLLKWPNKQEIENLKKKYSNETELWIIEYDEKHKVKRKELIMIDSYHDNNNTDTTNSMSNIFPPNQQMHLYSERLLLEILQELKTLNKNIDYYYNNLRITLENFANDNTNQDILENPAIKSLIDKLLDKSK